MDELNGADFRARVELTNKDNEVVAMVGQTCERVDPISLGWLFAQKLIEPTAAAWADLGAAVDAPPVVEPVTEDATDMHVEEGS